MSIKVLIVDDSRLARMSVIRVLARLRPDFTYVEAGDADEALSIAKEQAVQAAVVDFNMPGRDGLALSEELLVLHPGLKIAILSANAQDEIIAATERLGGVFLTKPLAEAALDAFLPKAGIS